MWEKAHCLASTAQREDSMDGDRWAEWVIVVVVVVGKGRGVASETGRGRDSPPS